MKWKTQLQLKEGTRPVIFNELCQIQYRLYPRIEIIERYNKKMEGGLLITKCGAFHYFIAKSMTNSFEMVKFCCKLGMIPAFIQSKSQMTCISDARNGTTFSNASFLWLGVWKSDNISLSSCYNKEFTLPNNLWRLNNLNSNQGVTTCVTLSLLYPKAPVLEFVNCTFHAYVFCQYDPKTFQTHGININKTVTEKTLTTKRKLISEIKTKSTVKITKTSTSPRMTENATTLKKVVSTSSLKPTVKLTTATLTTKTTTSSTRRTVGITIKKFTTETRKFTTLVITIRQTSVIKNSNLLTEQLCTKFKLWITPP